jgi:hypothetical protein
MHPLFLRAEDWYLICFGVGLVLSVAAFAGGFGHLHLGHLHPGHLPSSHGHGAHLTHGHAAHAGRADAAVSPLNGFTLLTFLAWFGGAGYLLRHLSGLAGALVFALALVSGLAGASLIFWFLARVLLPRERVLTAEDTEMTGLLARVSRPITLGGTGEIAYTQGGAHRAAAARSDAGAAIARDAEVVVLRYERGVAYVRTLAELEGHPQP